ADRPPEALAAEEVAREEGRRQAERRRNDREAVARLERIDVDDDDHVVLHVGDDPLLLRVQPAQVVDALQTGLGAADLVQAPNERQQRPVETTLLDLVLLRIGVLLRSRAQRYVL